MRVSFRSLPDMRLLKAFALFLPFFTGIAQPQIIPDNPWIDFIPPEMYLSVAVRCGGILRWDVKKENIRIRDDGRELGVTNIWIPDTTARHCCISAALVADRSESMGIGTPSLLDRSRELAGAFLDAMDPVGTLCDEAVILSGGGDVTMDVSMTTDKTLLRSSMVGWKAAGASRTWDAALSAIQELVYNGMQECRGVYIFTEGYDTTSTTPIRDLVSLALSNRIKIYTIGLGPSPNHTVLTYLATQTGGRYFENPGLSDMSQAYWDLAYLPGLEPVFMQIVYPMTHCDDGLKHSVELTIRDLQGCPGEALWKRDYKVWSGATLPLLLALPLDTMVNPENFDIPILKRSDMPVTLNPATFEIRFNDSLLSFESASVNGCLLDGTTFSATPMAGGVRIRTDSVKQIEGTGELLKMRLRSLTARDSMVIPLTFTSCRIDTSCFMPVLASGRIIIRLQIDIDEPATERSYCIGDTIRVKWRGPPRSTQSILLTGESGIPILTIADSVSSGEIRWEIPHALTGGSGYRILVRQSDGAVATLSPRLTFATHPFMIREPADTIVGEGEHAVFHACAEGQPVPSIQWQRRQDSTGNWQNIGFVGSETLDITSTLPLDGSYYRARFSTGCPPDLYSRPARLTVLPEPVISLQPADRVVCVGDSAVFRIECPTEPPPAIQWQQSMEGETPFYDIPGASGNSCIIGYATSDYSGRRYRVRLTVRGLNVYSNAARLFVEGAPPRIVASPRDTILCTGDTLILSVAAEHATFYQWKKGDQLIPGATSPIFKRTKVSREAVGSYAVMLYGCDTISTAPVSVDVSEKLVIVRQPFNVSTPVGGRAVFSVRASGIGISYQWLKEGIPIPGATDWWFAIDTVKPIDGGRYSVIVTGAGNCGGAVRSHDAMLSILPTGIGEERNSAGDLELSQSYPNPIVRSAGGKPVTEILFTLRRRTYATLRVFDNFGRLVATLADGEMDAGPHSVRWSIPAELEGVYHYLLLAGGKSRVGRMVVLK